MATDQHQTEFDPQLLNAIERKAAKSVLGLKENFWAMFLNPFAVILSSLLVNTSFSNETTLIWLELRTSLLS